jgi:uncharacterized protein YuzB (UPF0349 family)
MKKADTDRIAKVNKFLSVALILLPILLFLLVYFLFGPYWDIISHYLNGRTIINLVGSNVNPLHVLSGENGYSLLYYFESYRAPISYLLFASLSTVFKNPILPYFIVAYALFLFSILEFSKETKIERSILLLLFINSSVIFFWFMVNGEEILSIIFAIFGTIYLIKDRPVSGLFFALSVLGKYPALVLLPMAFMLTTRKKMISGLVLELLVMLPFLAFNYLLYGNPIATFVISFYASSSSNISAAISWDAMLNVFEYLLAFSIAALAFAKFYQKRVIKIPSLSFKKLNRTERIFAVLLVLSVADFFLTALYHDAITQTRYSYLLLFSLILIASYVLTPLLKDNEKLKLLLLCFGVLAFAAACLATFYSLNNSTVYYYNPNNPNSVYSNVSSVLNGLGYGNCRVISNAWVPLLYSNTDAYSPFVSPEYYSQVVSKAYALINSTKGGILGHIIEEIVNNTIIIGNQNTFPRYDSDMYPIVEFRYIGVSPYQILNLNSSRVLYNGSDFVVLAPKNVTCYRN